MKSIKFRLPMWAAALPLLALICVGVVAADDLAKAPTFAADDSRFEYIGRVDFTNPKLPRFWSPGVTIEASFTGTYCDVLLNDQQLWGNTHNYIEIVVDGVAKRYQTTGVSNDIQAAEGLSDGTHTILICKDTESGNGYLEFTGLRCSGLAKPPKLPKRKIEFIGDSITVGFGNDQSEYPCGQGSWYAQHNAYMSYGEQTARLLGSQWLVSAVSGIGMTHSCCNMTFTMPDVYDQIATRAATDTYAAGAAWDFNRYQPDVVTVCLGQNDGPDVIKGLTFMNAYEGFVTHLRTVYPKAQIVLLTSPMGNTDLNNPLASVAGQIVQHRAAAGDAHVSSFTFSRSWNDGCDTHPSMDNDTQIASELAGYLKPLMHW